MKKETIAHIVLLFVAFIWGSTFTLVKDALDHIDVFVFLFQRFLLSAIFFIPFVIYYFSEFNFLTILHGFWLGIYLFLAYACQTIGLKYTTASNAGFITGMYVILVPFLNSIIFKRKVPLNAKIGSVLAFLGLFLLSAGENLSINKGDIWVFFCAIWVSLHIIFTEKYTHKHNSFNLAFVQMVVLFVFSGIWAIGSQHYYELFYFHKNTFWALFICSVFASNFAFWAQTYFQRFTIPTKTAIIFSGEPVFAAIFAYFMRGEVIGIKGIVGGILIFIGMILTEIEFNKVQN